MFNNNNNNRPRQQHVVAPGEFEEKVIQVNRVSKKTKGGNKVGFSVLVVVGDKKGRVGVGLGGAPDVQRTLHRAPGQPRRRSANWSCALTSPTAFRNWESHLPT